jgi:hypothetical protein
MLENSFLEYSFLVHVNRGLGQGFLVQSSRADIVFSKGFNENSRMEERESFDEAE